MFVSGYKVILFLVTYANLAYICKFKEIRDEVYSYHYSCKRLD